MSARMPTPPAYDESAEQSLILASLDGDREAFASLYLRYREPLYATCQGILKDSSLAEDAVQDTFVRALSNLARFELGKKKFWPWLLTIAKRRCIDIKRRGIWSVPVDNPEATSGAYKRSPSDSTFEEVLSAHQRVQINRALWTLPARQRRALLLHAVEGWSYNDIASAEGVSLGAVRLLLVRARRKMRLACQGGPVPLILFPFWWLRGKIGRIRMALGANGEGLSSVGAQAISLGILAVMVITLTDTSPTPASGQESQISALSSPSAVAVSQPATFQTAPPSAAVPAKVAVESRPPVVEARDSLGDAVINTNQYAAPENSSLYSITASPDYANDHTIMATGYCWNCGVPRVLFVSPDGGATWKPVPSRLLYSYSLALSPGYSQDRRIFTFGWLGLQQSDDGGEIFRTVSPVIAFGAEVAVLSSLGNAGTGLSGETKVLMGGRTVFEYDTTTGLTQPAFPSIPPARSVYFYIAYSSGYLSDRTVFVSDNYPDQIHYRCKAGVCEETRYPIAGPMTLRLSPRFDQDGIAYAFTQKTVLVSDDGARGFRDLQFPLADEGYITDMAISWNASPGPVIFASTSHGVSASLYRSVDGGRSWSSSQIGVPGFGLGADKLVLTPTGRLLATGVWSGAACSQDGGRTWAPRCTPE